jgi:hypothetical protein
MVACCCLGMTAAVTAAATAQAKETGKAAIVAAPDAKQDPPPKSTSASPAATPIQELAVHARAVERPLMKYRLFPAEYDLRAGNAAPILVRFPWEQTAYFSQVVPTFDEYLKLPLDHSKLRNAGDVFNPHFYSELKRAAYRRTAEWEYPIGEKPLANILLPDIQGARSIVGRGLSVWIRHKISRGKLAEAREGILVGLAVSRHYGRTPFVITQLVCIAVDSMMLSRLEELLSQPDSPNLYWALTALPRPLVDLRPSIELEQRFLQMTVPGLENLAELRTEEEWTERAHAVIGLFLEPGGASDRTKISSQMILERLAKRGRAELPGWIEGGTARVTAMSDSEAGLRWFLHAHEEQSQEVAAFMSLEPPAAIPRLEALQQRLAEFRAEWGVPNLFVLESSLRTYVRAHGLQRQIDALRVVEAIRNYGASHESHVPESVEKIIDTPIPEDPFTGKPFGYAVTAGTATLSAPGIPVEGTELGGIRYRVKMRK